jgi:hypothetical protein
MTHDTSGIAAVVRGLRSRRGEIEAAIYARVRDAVPMSDRVGEDVEYVQGLREAVAAAVSFGLRTIERELVASPSSSLRPEEVPEVAIVQARRAARGGVSADAVLRRYVLGHMLLWDFVMEEANQVGEGQALREMSQSQSSALDHLMEAVAYEHAQERERMGRSQEQRRLELVRGLLEGEISVNGDGGHGRVGGIDVTGGGWAGGTWSAAGGESAVQELGYELDAEHVGVIARGADVREALGGLARTLDRRLLCLSVSEGMAWAWLGGRRSLRMETLRHAGRELPEGVCLVVGEPAWGLAGFRSSHRQAQAGLAVALRRSPTGLTRYGDVALLASALKDEMLAQALIEIYIAPLRNARDGGAALRQTLRAYLAAECSVSSTAAALGVVRNTIEKRLRAIEEHLDCSLHPCPAELGVALALDEIGVDTDMEDAPDAAGAGGVAS